MLHARSLGAERVKEYRKLLVGERRAGLLRRSGMRTTEFTHAGYLSIVWAVELCQNRVCTSETAYREEILRDASCKAKSRGAAL